LIKHFRDGVKENKGYLFENLSKDHQNFIKTVYKNFSNFLQNFPNKFLFEKDYVFYNNDTNNNNNNKNLEKNKDVKDNNNNKDNKDKKKNKKNNNKKDRDNKNDNNNENNNNDNVNNSNKKEFNKNEKKHNNEIDDNKNKIFIAGLPTFIDKKSLEIFFKDFSVTRIFRPSTVDYAFISFENENDFNNALKLNGTLLKEHTLVISKAKK
jgi:hypothetical protein